MRIKQRDERGEQTDERALRFRLAAVFDICQTEPLPDREPAPLSPPSQPVAGDSHAHLLTPLEKFAPELGYSVRELALEGSAEGWCDAERHEIVVGEGLRRMPACGCSYTSSPTRLGVGYADFGRARAEVRAGASALADVDVDARFVEEANERLHGARSRQVAGLARALSGADGDGDGTGRG